MLSNFVTNSVSSSCTPTVTYEIRINNSLTYPSWFTINTLPTILEVLTSNSVDTGIYAVQVKAISTNAFH